MMEISYHNPLFPSYYLNTKSWNSSYIPSDPMLVGVVQEELFILQRMACMQVLVLG